MNKSELIKKITQKKEFSKLPKRDVELVLSKFDDEEYDEDKVKFSRDLLMKVFSGFASQKLLKIKDKSEEWILGKHLSSRERIVYYKKVYSRILKGFEDKISVIDLGAGVNGFSYKYFKKDVFYVGVEAIGQLVELTNHYFMKEKISGKAFHVSLFEIEKIKKIIKGTKKPRVVFLFKTIDSLEMLERDYSKKLILELAPLVDRIVVSFTSESMIKRRKFFAKRKWIVNFIKDNFKIIDNFELGGERYIVFEKSKDL